MEEWCWMWMNWLQTSKIAMWVLTMIRIWVGYKWLTAGWSKLTGGFDASGFMKGAIAKSAGEHPPVQGWWAAFLEHAALPGVKFFNIIVPLGEFLVGLGLILGTFTTFAALMGLVMNFAYLFSGSINTNGQLLLLEFLLILSAANAGKIGLDRWLMPFLKRKFDRKMNVSYHEPLMNNQTA